MTVCTVASVPGIWLVQSCTESAAFCTPALVIVTIALAIINFVLLYHQFQLAVPWAFVEGYQSACQQWSCSYRIYHFCVQMFGCGCEWHKLSDAALNELHSLLQLAVSSLEGPAEPVILRALRVMSIWSNSMVKLRGSLSMIGSGNAGSLGGRLSISMSLTVLLVPIWLSNVILRIVSE